MRTNKKNIYLCVFLKTLIEYCTNILSGCTRTELEPDEPNRQQAMRTEPNEPGEPQEPNRGKPSNLVTARTVRTERTARTARHKLFMLLRCCYDFNMTLLCISYKLPKFARI